MILTVLALLAAGQTPVVVPAANPLIRYVGRFDRRDPSGPKCAWSASTVEIRFQGKDLVARVKDTGTDFLQAEVDGRPTQVIALKNGEDSYTVQVPDAGIHTVRLIKRTEPFVGTVQYLSFAVDGKLLSTKAPKRRIEIIGDSISCAYGNEGANQNERFKPETENAYMGYGPIAARQLDADCTVIAWSGRKMWPDNTVPDIYGLAVPTDPTSTWEFKTPSPDVVLINLATNDFGKDNPEEKGWTTAYESFIARLRTHYPKAYVYCAIGPMMTDNWPPEHKSLATLRGYLERMVLRIHAKGDGNVALLEFSAQDIEHDGSGSDWHPNIRTDQKMADLLTRTVRNDLKW